MLAAPAVEKEVATVVEIVEAVTVAVTEGEIMKVVRSIRACCSNISVMPVHQTVLVPRMVCPADLRPVAHW